MGQVNWHRVDDTPLDYMHKVGSMNIIYCTKEQYETLKDAGKLVPNALYLTPDEMDSTGDLLTRDDIAHSFTSDPDKISDARLVWLLLKRIEALESYIQIVVGNITVSHDTTPSKQVEPIDTSKYVKQISPQSAERPWAPVGIVDKIDELDNHVLVKTETP